MKEQQMLKKLQKAVYDMFSIILHVDMKSKTYTTIYAQPDFKFTFVPEGEIGGWIKDFNEACFVGEYLERANNFLSIDTIEPRLKLNEYVVTECQCRFGNRVLIYMTRDELDKNGDLNSFVLSIQTIYRKDYLKFEDTERKKQLSIIEAMGSIYFSIYYCTLVDKMYYEMSSSDNLKDIVGRSGDLYGVARTFITKDVIPEHQQKMRLFTDPDTISQRIHDKIMITCEFLSKTKGWCRLSYIATEKDEFGKVLTVLAVMQLIDDEKRKELNIQNELREAYGAAKKANIAKSEFLSRMSHDIRTPLNGIRGMLDIIEKNYGNKEKFQECQSKMRQASDYLLSLINDVLDMSKMESGVLELQHIPFDLRKLCDEVITLNEIKTNENGLSLNIDYDDSLAHTSLIGSPLHIRQVLMNIISNAIKYNKANGSIKCLVKEMGVSENKAVFKIVISDTGIGMSREYQKHIFEPFTQEYSDARSRYQGTGLGMAIVKSLVEKMEGNIFVQSRLNKGSIFTVILPILIDENPIEEEEEIEDKNISIRDMNILVVEDNELNMEIAEFILEDAGANVYKAFNGQEALDVFSQSDIGKFDVILMDIMMPVMDGLIAAKKIRVLDRADAMNIPIIAMTANAFLEDVQKSKEAGMNEHLTKPLESLAMLKAIAKYNCRI